MTEPTRELYVVGIGFLRLILMFILTGASIVLATYVMHRYFDINLNDPIPYSSEPLLLLPVIIGVFIVVVPVIYVWLIASLIIVKPLITCSEFEAMLLETLKPRLFQTIRRSVLTAVGCQGDTE